MKKMKEYSVKFSPRILRKAMDACQRSTDDTETRLVLAKVTLAEENWQLDDVEEFLSLYQNQKVRNAELYMRWPPETELNVFMLRGITSVSISNSKRGPIEAAFSVFEEAPPEDKTEDATTSDSASIRIFIGHGRSSQWMKLKDHLQDKHELDVLAYETGARAGHAIRDILDDMSNDSTFALLVLTGEDKVEDGLRARQNVIHECGLFQGRLGFDRAIMLVEQGVELASNFDGIQQLRFKKGRISEVFGDVLATIRREFGPI